MECMSIGFVSVYAVLAVLWFIALNFLTFQKDAESVAVSGRLAGVIKNVVGIGFYVEEGDIEKRLRFLAHPIGFGVLAVLSINAVMAMCLVAAGENAAGAGMRGTVVVIIFTVFWSVASEVLKRCIPGRHCNGVDIIANLISVGVGSAGTVLTVIA